MQSAEIRKRFLSFFAARGHQIIPSASLVPANDPSVLFTTAGMQSLVPYLLGQPHPAGHRLVNVQKCVRTQDIEEVGDNTHDTFFEMLGNWSLGDPAAADGIGAGYFKREAIAWSYELLTSREAGFGLDPKRLYIACFAGDADAPRDEESAAIWASLGVPQNRIYFLGKEKNWWSAGADGPCGPDTEMHYDVSPQGLGDLTLAEFKRAADETQEIVEIWNDVFMEYEKKDGRVVGKLPQKNVDTGAGLERLAMALQKKRNIFETDLFAPIMAAIEAAAPAADLRIRRVIADHLRTAVFMIADGIKPANKDRGYILRRLLRRAIFFGHRHGETKPEWINRIVEAIVNKYREIYPELGEREEAIKVEIAGEAEKFYRTLEAGVRMFTRDITKDIAAPGVKRVEISGREAFELASTYGFPLELIVELAADLDLGVDLDGFERELKKHQAASRLGAEKKFKGGLADASDASVKYHTTTHLLHQALRDILGGQVRQQGSNITPERLRFDFTYERKLTADEKTKIEAIVNQKIQEDLPVRSVILPRAEAAASGAHHFFGEKYGDQVSVYYIGNDLNSAYSKEFCGGPHVGRTGELGRFKITKEEAVAAGVRRIKAVLESRAADEAVL